MPPQRADETRKAGAHGTDRLVGLMVDQGPDVLVGMLGILGAKRGFVPLDPRNPDARLAHVLDDCSIRILVTDERHAERAQHLTTLVPSLSHVVVLDDHGNLVAPAANDDAPTDDDVAVAAARPVSNLETGPTHSTDAPHPDSLAYVIFTSGSTGEPKGVGITHRNLAPMLAWAQDYFALGNHTRALQSLSYWFDFGVFEQLTTALSGGTLCIAPETERGDPARFAARAAAWRANTVHCTPSFARELAASGEDLSAIRILHLGGEALSTAQVDRLQSAMAPDCTLYNGYGPTEATINSTIFDLGSRDQPHHHDYATMPIGRPSANHRVFILDRRGRPVPPGIPGELHVGGGLVARGYLGRPALTAERFVPDPFDSEVPGGRLYRTGDLVRFLPDGNIAFLGRVDHQVKLRGFRIELGEIEAALRHHPDIDEAVAQVREVQPGDSRLVAWHSGQYSGDDVTLREHLRTSLPEYMVPAAFVSIDAWPTTRTGKIDLKALPDPNWLAATPGRAPATPLESQLAALFADVLGRDEINADDDFFTLGGHSLLATRVVAGIRRDLAVDLPLMQLFESPTVAATATAIESIWARGGSTDEEAAIVALPRERDAITALPLSPAQERLWILDRFEPGTAAFNMPLPLRLEGQLDVPALGRALDEIVRRHESLRTTFASVRGVPQQHIHPPAPVELEVVDLTDLATPHRDAEMNRLVAEDARTAFDLEQGPLFRASLLRLAEDRHALLLNLHHVISDGWSIGILTRELGALYDAFQQGRPSPLVPLNLQYADYAVWQRERLTGPLADRQLAYWRERLGDQPAALELPLDRPRPPVQTYRGAKVTAHLDAATVEALEALSRTRNASLFMTLLAAFKVVLARWSGRQDIVVGTPIAGRNRAATEDLIGIFLNTLVLRTDVSGDATFNEVVDRVRDTALGAYAHQDLPFERLLDMLQPERDLARTPLFQIFFNMLNLPARSIELDDLRLETIASPELPSKFDLTLYAGPQPNGRFALTAAYNADLFDEIRITEVLAQYTSLLAQVAESPTAKIAGFDVATAPLRDRLPDPTAPLDSSWNGAVHERFFALAEAEGDRPAVIAPEGTWTYAELADTSRQLAAYLAAKGVAQGDAVAICAHRSASLVWAVLGVLARGAVFVLLDPAYPPERSIAILRQAKVRAWLALEAAGPVPEDLTAYLEGVEDLVQLVLPPWQDLAERNPFEGSTRPAPTVSIGPDDPALYAFTSGSTGEPKGIVGRHGPLTHFLPFQAERFGLGPDDRYSMLSGLAHDPLQRDLFTALALGGAICVPDPGQIFHPGYLARWLRDQRITVAHLTPAMGQLMTQAGGDAELAVAPDLRWVLLVGDVLTRRDVQRLQRLGPGAGIVNLFGSTETQRAVAYHVCPDADDDHAKQVLPLGRGMPDVQLLILRDDDQLATIGEVGEIAVRSPHLARGYLNDDAMTAARFTANPFTDEVGDRIYRTGDLGRYAPSGDVVFAGRADQQIQIRGYRVELGEIQAQLASLPAVAEAIVLADQPTPGDTRLTAFVVPEGDADVTAAPLRDQLGERLPSYMVPTAFVPLDAIPLTPNGKTDRRALSRIQATHREVAMTYQAPRDAMEASIVKILQSVLGIEQVGVDDNFFELGANSLLLVQVHAQLQEILNRELHAVEIFNHPTVALLARHLSDGTDAEPAGPVTPNRQQQRLVGRDRLRRRRLQHQKGPSGSQRKDDD